MHPVSDMDAVLLLATALASKRRPAQLVEIIAAADLLQGFIPYERKLGEGLCRLATHGLVREKDGGFELSPEATKIVAGLSARADAEERIGLIKEKLLAHVAKGEHPPIVLTPEQFSAALSAHRANQSGAGRNMLMPKPKADRHFKVDGKWRRVSGSKGRKT